MLLYQRFKQRDRRIYFALGLSFNMFNQYTIASLFYIISYNSIELPGT